MRRKIPGVIFLIVSVTLLSIGMEGITGSTINNYFQGTFLFIHIFGLALLLASVLILTSRKTLDAIIIPTGGGNWDYDEKMYSMDRDRAKKAIEHKKELRGDKYFVISGYKGKSKEDIKEGQSYSIYKFLRRYGIKPSQMIIEGRSHDTLENALYTLKKLKEKKEKKGIEEPLDIAFVSYPGHLKRFEDFENEAIKKGLIDKNDFNFHKIETKETPEDKNYEKSIMRILKHKYKLVTMEKYKSKNGEIKYLKEK